MTAPRAWPLLAGLAIASPAIAQDEDPAWSIEPRGRVQYDVGHVDAPDAIVSDQLGWVEEFRSIRAGVEGRMLGLFDYVVEFDFAENDVALTDATLTYATGPLSFTAGHQKTLSGLEELTSENYTSFLERAAFTDAFGFERRVGLSATYRGGDYAISGGVFTDDWDSLVDDTNDGYSIDARAVWYPELGERTRLHLGGAVHWRDIGQAEQIRYRQRPFIHASDIRFISTPELRVDEEFSAGVEAMLIRGRFHAAGEAHWYRASLADGGRSPGFFGGYAEIGWYLTPGDTRGYRNGRIDRNRPDRPIGEGGFGAVEANLRYDYLDLTDRGAGVVGGTQHMIAASLIWTLRDDLRIAADYATIAYRDAAITAAGDPDYTVNVFAARAQFDF